MSSRFKRSKVAVHCLQATWRDLKGIARQSARTEEERDWVAEKREQWSGEENMVELSYTEEAVTRSCKTQPAFLETY